MSLIRRLFTAEQEMGKRVSHSVYERTVNGPLSPMEVQQGIEAARAKFAEGEADRFAIAWMQTPTEELYR